jgi:hypothetical protein
MFSAIIRFESLRTMIPVGNCDGCPGIMAVEQGDLIDLDVFFYIRFNDRQNSIFVQYKQFIVSNQKRTQSESGFLIRWSIPERGSLPDPRIPAGFEAVPHPWAECQ